LLNAYAERISGAALSSLLASNLAERGGSIDWGELTLVEDKQDRQIGMSFYGRWAS
jgi:23S rRNA (cytosine1962-C5)-methyltransferase